LRSYFLRNGATLKGGITSYLLLDRFTESTAAVHGFSPKLIQVIGRSVMMVTSRRRRTLIARYRLKLPS
jgi:hypothetical protein